MKFNFERLLTGIRIVSFFAALLVANFSFGQTCNPCFAIVDGGNWNSAASWSNSSGGGATTNIPGATDTVHIGEAGSMTINLAADANAAKLIVGSMGTVRFNAAFVDLILNNGDSLVVKNGGLIDGNGQSFPILQILGNNPFTVSCEGPGVSMDDLERIYILNSGTKTFIGSGDIIVNDLFRLSSNNSSVINNMTGTLNIGELRASANNSSFTNNSKTIISGNCRLLATNTTLINNDTLIIGGGMDCILNTNDGHIITNNDYISIAGNITLSDADWTINNSGTLIHDGNFLNVAGAEVFNNLNGGNWFSSAASHAGVTMNCDDAVNTFVYNGTGAQDVFVPSDGEYYNLEFQNTGLKTLGASIICQDSLFMTSDFVDLATFSLTIGTAPGTPGTIEYTAGGLYGGDLTRYFNSATIADGDPQGLFPMANSDLDTRPFHVTPSVAPTTGGTITVSTSNTTTVTDVSVVDGGSTILRRYDGSWTVASGGSLAGGTYNVRGGGTGFGEIGDVNDLRLMQSAGVVGTAGANGGTTADPEVNRTGLTFGEITNDFYLGSVAAIRSPLPISVLSFEGNCMDNEIGLRWIISKDDEIYDLELQNSEDGVQWLNVGSDNIVVDIDRLVFQYSEFSHQDKNYFRLWDPVDNEAVEYKTINCESGKDHLIVFPLPSNEEINISGLQGVQKIEIWDLKGKILAEKFIGKEKNSIAFMVKEWPEGIYIIKGISESGRIYNRRLIVSD